jgi:hypothetical protein
MNKKKIIGVVVVVIVLALGVWFFFSSGLVNPSVKLSGASLERVVMKGPTDSGYLSFSFASERTKPVFVNAFLDLNGDGKYEAYDVGGKRQEEHVVVDFPASVVSGEAAGYPVKLVDRSVDGKRDIKGVAIFSAGKTASSSPDHSDGVPFTIASVDVQDMSDFMDVGNTDGKRRGFSVPDMTSVRTAVLPIANAQGAGGERPTEYFAKSNDLPDTNQNYNECAPTAVSNNVRFLAKKYKFENRIPSDTRELINELKADLSWDDGVFDSDFIAGKNAFFARRGIPIVTHQIGTKNDVDIHYKIFEEMRKGQAVELSVSFFDTDPDGTMHPAGGHMIAVSSVYRVEGKNYVAINDSATRSKPGEVKSEYYEMNGDMIPNYNGTAFIDFAYAQSPTDELAKGTYVDPTKDETNLVAGAGSTLTPSGTEVTRGLGKFGFFFADIENPGDHMVGESFPIAATVVKKRNIEQTMGYWIEDVRHEYKHKAADPWTLGGTFTVRGSAAAPTNKFDAPRKGVIAGERNRAEATFTCTSPGAANIAYTADITWARGGGEPPAQLLPRYAAQLEPSEKIVVESPTFFCKSATPLPKKEEPRTAAPVAFCPEVVEDPNGQEIDVLKKGAECYPVMQFHQADADKCDAKHWHANAGTARSVMGYMWSDPSGCGFGKTSEVQAGKVKLSPDQVAPYIENVPGGR